MRASYGTTKYCMAFLRGVSCTDHTCMNLHEWGDEKDCFTKEDLTTLYVWILRTFLWVAYPFPGSIPSRTQKAGGLRMVMVRRDHTIIPASLIHYLFQASHVLQHGPNLPLRHPAARCPLLPFPSVPGVVVSGRRVHHAHSMIVRLAQVAAEVRKHPPSHLHLGPRRLLSLRVPQRHLRSRLCGPRKQHHFRRCRPHRQWQSTRMM
jgi:hypothetical protein